MLEGQRGDHEDVRDVGEPRALPSLSTVDFGGDGQRISETRAKRGLRLFTHCTLLHSRTWRHHDIGGAVVAYAQADLGSANGVEWLHQQCASCGLPIST